MDISNLLDVYNELDQRNKENFIRQLNLSNEEEFFNLMSDIPRGLNDYLVYDLHYYLELYVPPVLFFIGALGNILAFVMFQTYSKNISTYTLLSALAVTDFFVLNVGLLRLWVENITSIDVADQANWVCKLVMFLGYVCSDSSVWLIVAVTVERCIAVCNPLHAHNTCAIHRAKYVIALPILFFAVINSHFLITVELVSVNISETEIYMCEASLNYRVLVQEVWPWVDAILYSFFPFLILIVLNGTIIYKVVVARAKRDHLMNRGRATDGCNKNRSNSSWKLTFMLLLVSFTFVLTTLPMNVIMIYTAFWNENNQHSAEQIANYKLAKTVSELLMYVNHSINFYLYCITGRKFRRQIYVLLCKCSPNISNDDKCKCPATDSNALTPMKCKTRVNYEGVPDYNAARVFDSL